MDLRNNQGLQRWPIHPSATNGSELLIGPPQRIGVQFAPRRLASDQAVQKLALVGDATGQAMVLDLATRSTLDAPVSHPMADYVAVSPDAKWLATSGWHSDRVQLRNLQTGKLVKDWVVGLETKVAFTPDSRELIVEQGGEFHFVNVRVVRNQPPAESGKSGSIPATWPFRRTAN